MSENKYAGLDQYGAEPFEQQQFGTAGAERVNSLRKLVMDGQLSGFDKGELQHLLVTFGHFVDLFLLNSFCFVLFHILVNFHQCYNPRRLTSEHMFAYRLLRRKIQRILTRAAGRLILLIVD